MLPLTQWNLFARELPEEMTGFARPSGFSLPGAKALEGFSDLLGENTSSSEIAEPELESAPFSLPSMLPKALEGSVSLKREIDFGALRGDRAVLTIDHIIGKGRILLGDHLLCAFDGARFDADALSAVHEMTALPCMLAIELTDALQAGRRETLFIEFDENRPAGLPGPVLLHVINSAHMTHISVLPDAKQKTVRISATIDCQRPGRYVLRAQSFAADEPVDTARETALTLAQGKPQRAQFSLPLPGSVFTPGKPYDAAAVKIQLFARKEQERGDGLLCDSTTLMTGYALKAPQSWLLLDRAAVFGEPAQVVSSLADLHIPAVSLDEPAPDGLYRAFSRAGIAVRQYLPQEHPLRESLCRLPCLCLTDQPAPDAAVSPEANAWQLCSMVGLPRSIDETLTARELLWEASGLPLDPKDEGVRAVLHWLRAVSIRLRAEASRQQRYHGALCAAKEWEMPDIADALRAAFAPVHLSVLPLYGAWWTSSRFSATLEAFIPKDAYGADLTARAVLEDEQGDTLAQFDAPCRTSGGYVGVIEAALPDHPCVLELKTQLLKDGEIVEESTLPVYVGERGPLEAAFG